MRDRARFNQYMRFKDRRAKNNIMHSSRLVDQVGDAPDVILIATLQVIKVGFASKTVKLQATQEHE